MFHAPAYILIPRFFLQSMLPVSPFFAGCQKLFRARLFAFTHDHRVLFTAKAAEESGV